MTQLEQINPQTVADRVLIAHLGNGASVTAVRDGVSVDSSDVHTYKDYSIHVTEDSFGMTRDALAEALLAENIETKKYFYPPLHQQDIYKPFYNRDREDLSQTEYITGGVLSLPIYESLPDETVKTVAQAIKDLVDFEPDQNQSAISGRPSRVSAL